MWEIHNSNLTQHIIFLSKNNKKSLISKCLESGENLQETNFIWDGSHLVQEIDHKTNRTYRYIYSYPNSYEPLAQLVFAKNSKKTTACYYYHNDQIGVPRELTDEDGKLCWYGDYTGWGKLKDEYALVENIHQPFRLQNQYCDQETGLHYNFFRYYEPNVRRFTQLDPIGLAGGSNLYLFSYNIVNYIDPLGLMSNCPFGSSDYLIGLSEQAKAEQIIQKINSQAYYESEGSIGIETDGDISIIKKINGTIGIILTKNKNSNAINMCVYASKCDGIEIGGGGGLSVQGVMSNAETTSGVSHSMCTGASATWAGGVSGSACLDATGNKTITGGLQIGAKAGASVKQCIQFTKCTNF